MHPIETLEDVLHAVTNMPNIISLHSQYLLCKRELVRPPAEELRLIHDEAQRAASLLRRVPPGLARSPIEEIP